MLNRFAQSLTTPNYVPGTVIVPAAAAVAAAIAVLSRILVLHGPWFHIR